jgi:hypothetical protein
MVLLPLYVRGSLESSVPDPARQLSRHRLHPAPVAPKFWGPLPHLRPLYVQTQPTPSPPPTHPGPPNRRSHQTHPYPEAAYSTTATTAATWCLPRTATTVSCPGWLRGRSQSGRFCLSSLLGTHTSLQPTTYLRGQLVPVLRTTLT